MIRYRLSPSTAPKVKGIVKFQKITPGKIHILDPNGALEDDFPFQLGDF